MASAWSARAAATGANVARRQGRRFAPPRPRPSTTPGRNGCHGCRARRLCGLGWWRSSRCLPVASFSALARTTALALSFFRPSSSKDTPSARIRPGCPSAGGFPAQTAAHASTPNHQHRFHTGHHRHQLDDREHLGEVPSSKIGNKSGNRAARCRSPKWYRGRLLAR